LQSCGLDTSLTTSVRDYSTTDHKSNPLVE
jgi:hypothetical protein